jgi:hypothetical protein
LTSVLLGACGWIGSQWFEKSSLSAEGFKSSGGEQDKSAIAGTIIGGIYLLQHEGYRLCYPTQGSA